MRMLTVLLLGVALTGSALADDESFLLIGDTPASVGGPAPTKPAPVPVKPAPQVRGTDQPVQVPAPVPMISTTVAPPGYQWQCDGGVCRLVPVQAAPQWVPVESYPVQMVPQGMPVWRRRRIFGGAVPVWGGAAGSCGTSS
jgi:hypothetical protein